jgi:hypothetical protein
MIVVYSEVERIQVILKSVYLDQVWDCGIRKSLGQIKSWANQTNPMRYIAGQAFWLALLFL